MIWFTYDTLFSQLLEARTINEIRSLFRLHPSEYWSEHYSFKHKSPVRDNVLREKAINILMINTVAPFFSLMERKKHKLEFCERAIQLQERLPAEQNSIIRLFEKANVSIKKCR
jgi:hypothetical protein